MGTPKSGPEGNRLNRPHHPNGWTEDRIKIAPPFNRTGGKSSGWQVLGKITRRILGKDPK